MVQWGGESDESCPEEGELNENVTHRAALSPQYVISNIGVYQ